MVGVVVQGGAAGGTAQVQGSAASASVVAPASKTATPIEATSPRSDGGTVAVQATRVGGSVAPASQVTVIEVDNTSSNGDDGESYIASDVVSGDKALMFKPDGTVVHADPTRTHYVYAGIALNAAQPGGQVFVKREGVISAAFWTWIFGQPVFTAPEGNLTQDEPQTGYSHIVAFAIGTSSLRLFDDDLILIGDT